MTEHAERSKRLVLAPMLLGAACYTGVHEHGGAGEQDDPAANDDGVDDDDGGGADDGDDGADDGDDGADACLQDGGELVGATPLRRLTAREYRHSIEDLLGLGEMADAALEAHDYIADGRAGPFATSTLPPDMQVMRKYLTMSEDLADLYVAERLAEELACDWAEPACVQELLADFGRRVFRRPLTEAEISTYLQVHAAVLDQGADAAMRSVVTVLLTSPGFLYREEPAQLDQAEGLAVPLEPYAFASRLSFLLWSSGPDDELLDAAGNGMLDDEADVRVQAERMMDDPRFVRALHGFYEQWAGLDALAAADRDDPAWTATLRDAMHTEALLFVEHVYGPGGDGTIAQLLGADFGFVNDELAAIYGIAPPAEPFGQVTLDADQRAGILSMAGVLTATANALPVVHRGLFVRERIMCDDLPEPPDIPLDPEVDRLNTEPCKTCHTMMDPIGLGLDRFDPIGRHRTEDADGNPISDAGEVIGAPNPDRVTGAFHGARELSELLIGSPQVNRCMAVHWAMYSAGRVESSEDSCAFDALGAAVEESGGDLRALVLDLATSKWLRSRSLSEF